MDQLERIQESLNYIESKLKENINLEELAKNASFSKYHYHRLFHSLVGEPVMEYVRKRRLSEAARELVDTNERLIDIAMKYQFSCEEAFIRSFRNMFGISPGQFRKEKKIIPIYSKVKARSIKPSITRRGSTTMCMAA